jgi:hypothetical protein
VRSESSFNDFGLFIAYVLPGLAAILGVARYYPTPEPWLGMAPDREPTIAGVISLTAAAAAVGLTLSTVRWFVIDRIHHATGLRPNSWDFAKLGAREAAFSRLVQVHYNFYQFYANAIVAATVTLFARHASTGLAWMRIDRWDGLIVTLVALFFAASRDALRRYYVRVGQLLR